MRVIALVNFEYPSSLTTRNRIRAERARGRRVPMDERGTLIQVQAGDMAMAPPDLLESWLEAGLAMMPPGGMTVPEFSPTPGEGISGGAND